MDIRAGRGWSDRSATCLQDRAHRLLDTPSRCSVSPAHPVDVDGARAFEETVLLGQALDEVGRQEARDNAG